jgi:hypothetical protein
MGEKRGACKLLFRKPQGKRLLERPKRRWEEYIKINLQKIVWEGMDWIDLGRDRDRWRRAVVNAVMKLRVS